MQAAVQQAAAARAAEAAAAACWTWTDCTADPARSTPWRLHRCENVEHGMQPWLWLAATAAVSVLRSTSIMPALGPSKSAAYHAVPDWGSVGPAVADSCKALYRIEQPLET
jgi:hypothetical protein